MVNIVFYFPLYVSLGFAICPLMSPLTPILLRRRDVAILLSCHLNHVKNLIKQGKLLEVRIGKLAPRVTRESLDNFISEGQEQ